MIGIYTCFLTWGILQERITTVDYQVMPSYIKAGDAHGYWALNMAGWLYASYSAFVYKVAIWILHHVFSVKAHDIGSSLHSKFDSFIFLNFSQAIGSIIISIFVIYWKTGRMPLLFPITLGFLSRSEKQDSRYNEEKVLHEKYPPLDRQMFFSYTRIALCFCCASPFGYASLKYIGYVAMNLGKSCKLLPLIFISVFVRRQKIDTIKLISLLLITLGVSGFMLFNDKKSSKITEKVSNDGIQLDLDGENAEFGILLNWIPKWVMNFVSGSFQGMILLLMNLALDGAMNTWQDEMFSMYKLSSFHMMFHMNWISAAMMSLFFLSGLTLEWSNAIQFILRYPTFLPDLILFSICGAAGQAVVFFTIEKFGAVSLVTVTVTRKLFTILLSVICFGPQLNIKQWMSVAIVFVALALESTLSKHKKRIVPKSQLPIPDAPNDPTLYKVRSSGVSSSEFDLYKQTSDKKTMNGTDGYSSKVGQKSRDRQSNGRLKAKSPLTE